MTTAEERGEILNHYMDKHHLSVDVVGRWAPGMERMSFGASAVWELLVNMTKTGERSYPSSEEQEAIGAILAIPDNQVQWYLNELVGKGTLPVKE